MNLSEKTALVTGGGTGIGAACAVAMARQGCRVVVAGRREARLRELVSQYGDELTLLPHAVDVSDRESVARLFDWANRELGRIDILINSAGVNVPKRSMDELTPEDWDLILKINATGPYNCMRAVLPQMRERQDGIIINISSIAGKRAGLLGGVAYNASKFAMSALGTTAGLEEKDHGIRVTTVSPGEVETPILDDRPVPVSAEHRQKILQPEDVAAAVLMIVQLPPRAHVPELVIKPTTQAYS